MGTQSGVDSIRITPNSNTSLGISMAARGNKMLYPPISHSKVQVGSGGTLGANTLIYCGDMHGQPSAGYYTIRSQREFACTSIYIGISMCRHGQ